MLVIVGRTGPILWLSAGIVLTNLVASVLLVHGVGQWDGLGVAGAAWASAGVNVVAAACLAGVVGEVASARMAALRVAEERMGQRRLVRLSLALSGSAAGLLSTTALVFPELLAAGFSGPDTASDTRGLMALVLTATAPVFVLDAWQVSFVHLLRGLRRTVRPMLLSTVSYWLVGVGGGLILAEVGALGAAGIWTGFCVGLTAAAATLAVMTYRAIGSARR